MSDTSNVVTKSSPYSVAEAVARFNKVVAARDMTVFAVIDHSEVAHEAGPSGTETKVVFGRFEARTSVTEKVPLTALELPLKLILWEDEGCTKLSYTAPAALAERYGLSPDLARVLDGIDPLIDAVIFYSRYVNNGAEA
jgi:uncharacterized protein (DUF302 family)